MKWEKKIWVIFNNETSVKVDSLFKLAIDFNFINTLAITRNILDYLLLVTRKLQAKVSDIAQSIDLIKSLQLTVGKIKK